MASLQLLTNARLTTAVAPPSCALSKQGERFLTSIATSKDNSATTQSSLLRKFVKSSTKHVVLNTLSHLLSATATAVHRPHHSSVLLPLYLTITEASWFSWNAKLVADVVAAMYKVGRLSEAERLIEETVGKMGAQKGDLCSFYCSLIDSTAKHQLKVELLCCLTSVKEIVSSSSTSVHVRKKAYESMIGGLCKIGMPREAEELVVEMRGIGLKPSGFEFKSLVYAYGRLGMFKDMKRNVGEIRELDTVCCNMVLSALGSHNDLSEMVSWIQRMKVSKVAVSTRTYNSVLNSCPMIMSMLQDPKSLPLSMAELMEKLSLDEASLVMELVDPASLSVMDSVIMEWETPEKMKLDLHGMHLSSSYVIFLQWIEELRLKFTVGDYKVPAEVTLVCGSGKHSLTRGISPVKGLLKDVMMRMKCPLKIDRKNIGCFVAKGKVFRDWLLS